MCGNDEFLRGIMHALADLRNELVHPGRFLTGDRQINYAVRYAAALVALNAFNIAIQLKSPSALKQWCRLITDNDTTISSTIRAAKLIEESRR